MDAAAFRSAWEQLIELTGSVKYTRRTDQSGKQAVTEVESCISMDAGWQQHLKNKKT